jgi:hypothetical protein
MESSLSTSTWISITLIHHLINKINNNNIIITTRRLEQQHHHNMKVGETPSSQHEGWRQKSSQHKGWSNIIIIMEQQNEVGVTTFFGTLTVPKDLPRNHC